MEGSEPVGLDPIPLRNRALAAAANDQLSIRVRRRNSCCWRSQADKTSFLGNVRPRRLPMTGRRDQGECELRAAGLFSSDAAAGESKNEQCTPQECCRQPRASLLRWTW